MSGNHGIHIPYTNQWLNEYDAYGLYTGGARTDPGESAGSQLRNRDSDTERRDFQLQRHDRHLQKTVQRRIFPPAPTTPGPTTWMKPPTAASSPMATRSWARSTRPACASTTTATRTTTSATCSTLTGWPIRTSTSTAAFLRSVFNGWEWSGKWFWRSGLPFSVTDNNTALGQLCRRIFWRPDRRTGGQPGACNEAAAVTPCLNANAFVNGASSHSPAIPRFRRRPAISIRGPHYFDMDMNLYKTFQLRRTAEAGGGRAGIQRVQPPEFRLSR